jgi:hypothetical protein
VRAVDFAADFVGKRRRERAGKHPQDGFRQRSEKGERKGRRWVEGWCDERETHTHTEGERGRERRHKNTR